MMKASLRVNRTALTVVGLVAAILILGYLLMGSDAFVRTTLSGLTLGSLYFMVAAGLTLIFGLMDVLNFAHGAMFMIGAYLGWQFYTNPSFLFGLVPLISAALLGLMTSTLLRPWAMRWRVSPEWQERLPLLLNVAGLAIAVAGVWGLDVLNLSNTAMVALTIGVDPLSEIKVQEPLATYSLRVALVALGGMVAALGNAHPGDLNQVVTPKDTRRGWIYTALLTALTLALLFGREAAPVAVLQMNGNLRFVLALVVGTLAGAGLGAVIEMALISPLYVRPIYQVMVTLGLAYVLRELVMLLWKPLAYQMARPPFFATPGQASSVL